MDKYYHTIRKKSIKGVILGVVLVLGGAYFIYDLCIVRGMPSDDGIVYLVLWVGIEALGLFALISSLQDVSRLKKKISKMGLDESLLAQDLEGGLSYKDCVVGGKYALQCKSRPEVIQLDDALVIYMDVTSTTSKSYTTYSYYIKVVERSGEEKYLSANDDKEMKEIFTQLTQMRPYVITHMDSVIRELKKKNLSELIRIADERRSQYESGSIGSGNA